MAAARTHCQSHEDLSRDIREVRCDMGHVREDTAIIRTTVEAMAGIGDRVTVLEQEVRAIARSRRRWAGIFPTVVATVSSSGVTGAVVYVVSRM